MPISLTENEKILLKLCITAETREGQHQDNHTECGFKEATKALNMTKRQVQGVAVSLETKGLIYVIAQGEINGCNDWLCELTYDKGIDVAFDLLEQENK